MDKYFLIVLIEENGVVNKSVYEYETFDNAKKNALKQLGGFMLKEGVTMVKTFIDGPNNIEYYDKWKL